MTATTPTKPVRASNSNNAAALSEIAERIYALHKRVIGDVIEIGRLLTQARAMQSHGEWLPWLKREFRWSHDSALNFIRLATFADTHPKFRKFRILPISALYRLAASPEVIDEACAKLDAGDTLRVADVEQLIADAKRALRPIRHRGLTEPPPVVEVQLTVAAVATLLRRHFDEASIRRICDLAINGPRPKRKSNGATQHGDFIGRLK